MCPLQLVSVSGESFPDRTAPSCGHPGSRSVIWLHRALRDKWANNRLFLGNPTIRLTQWEAFPKHEAPVCATVQTESADCRWYEGNRCRLALLSCFSARRHFLEGHNHVITAYGILSLRLSLLWRQIWWFTSQSLIIYSHLKHVYITEYWSFQRIKWGMSDPHTNPCDLSDTAGWAAPCLLSCAGNKDGQGLR